jgi:hypothetical protein
VSGVFFMMSVAFTVRTSISAASNGNVTFGMVLGSTGILGCTVLRMRATTSRSFSSVD